MRTRGGYVMRYSNLLSCMQMLVERKIIPFKFNFSFTCVNKLTHENKTKGEEIERQVAIKTRFVQRIKKLQLLGWTSTECVFSKILVLKPNFYL